MRKTLDFIYWMIGVVFISALAAIAFFYLLIPDSNSDSDLGPFGLFYVAGIGILIWCMIIAVFCWIARRAYLTFKKDGQ
jgi:hypothetical protein